MVFRGKDALECNDVRMRKFLEMLEFSDGIGSHPFFILLLNLNLLDGDQGLWVISKVTKVDVGIGTFTKLLACSLSNEEPRLPCEGAGSTFYVFTFFFLVHLLCQITSHAIPWRRCIGFQAV